jgi:GMP synthase-like glutamine amidotransferase
MLLFVDLGYPESNGLEALIDDFCEVCRVTLDTLPETHHPDIKGIVIGPSGFVIPIETIDFYVEKIGPLFNWNLPLLGIGAGMHIIASNFGATYAPRINESTVVEIALLDETNLFDRMREEVEVVIQTPSYSSIPAGFELIATSDRCINEGMKHSTKPIYAIRFLPNKSGMVGRQVINNFVNISIGKI